MKVLGNVIWVIFGGWFVALEWLLFGLLNCITIIGIPSGVQAFKLSKLAFLPFGKKVDRTKNDGQAGKKVLAGLLNVIWILLGGIWIALSHAVLGCLFFITIIGIPFGKQHFKLANLAFAPFGATVAKDMGNA